MSLLFSPVYSPTCLLLRSGPPPLQWRFLHDGCSYKLSPFQGCWVGAATPAFSSWLVYLWFVWGIAPPSLSGAQGAPPSLLRVSFLFSSCLFIIQFVFFLSFFLPGWGSVCPGGYTDLAQGCLWEYCVPLSSPGGLRLPKQSGSWHLVAQEPSWFLHLM
jgi:hypothetical protein